MSATREQAMTALLARLSSAWPFAQVTRRPAAPESMASPGRPALALMGHKQTYERRSPNLPPKRVIEAIAVVYVDAGGDGNLVPEALLGPILDALDAALVPDQQSTGLCTLGGVVYSALIRGEIEVDLGLKTGKGFAVIPIEIVMP